MKKVALLLIANKDKFLLFKRSPKEQSNPGVYGLLGGKIERSETPRMALKREIKEEAGVDIKNFKPLGAYKKNDTLMYLFYCTDFPHKDIKLDTNEHVSQKWFNTSDIYNSNSSEVIETNKFFVRDFIEKMK